jgi:hypothetical protein
MRYIKSFESYNHKDFQKIDEGFKEFTAGVILTLATLIGGPAKSYAQQIAPDLKSTNVEVQIAKDFLDKNASFISVDTLNKITPKDSSYLTYVSKGGDGGELTKDELIKTYDLVLKYYYDKDTNLIGTEHVGSGELESGEKFGFNQPGIVGGDYKTSQYDERDPNYFVDKEKETKWRNLSQFDRRERINNLAIGVDVDKNGKDKSIVYYKTLISAIEEFRRVYGKDEYKGFDGENFLRVHSGFSEDEIKSIVISYGK